ncbi:testis-expressed protein 47 isoform X2 [Amblyraja radiata]|uniref:testis-expressed protein 47 isoform X2 n=1 Tax=Amblyraja radiata TaxID=386614 RepID=UPI001401D889|nr:testis-expressed protein 47 isoform X2 [Amblyraja radiata]
MASRAKRRRPSVRFTIGDYTYENRLSMLMHLLAKQREERKKSLLHRIVLLCKMPPDLVDKRKVGGYYESLLQRLQRCHQGDTITGLLMLYPNYVIHVVESSSDVLYSVIQDLSDMQKHQGERPLHLDSKILVMSHNIPSRLFQQWEYKVLNISAKRLDDNLQREPIEKIISETLTLLLKLGMHMQKKCKESHNSPTDSVLDDAPELIIPQNLIARLLEARELLTPAQFLHNYGAPLNVIMDSELVWPTLENMLPSKRP